VPELPDVEGFRRYFDAHALGSPVARVSADRDIVRNTNPQGVGRVLRHKRFEPSIRRGKWLVCPADSAFLVLHFGMTGLLVSSEAEPAHHHDRMTIAFDDGSKLRYRNMRKLGGVWLAPAQRDLDILFENIGPDALDVDVDAFLELARRRRGQVKAALLDQSFLAGPGNLVVDETLWRARLHPRRRMESFDRATLRRLFESLQAVLDDSLPHGCVPALEGWLLSVRGVTGARCPRCRAPIRRTVAGGRTTYFCPRCQRAPSYR
jgi:formamidopyrimidine-DNA glycosylase